MGTPNLVAIAFLRTGMSGLILSLLSVSPPGDSLQSASAWVAVLFPAALSCIIVGWYVKAGRLSRRLQLVWIASLAITLCCTRWDYSGDLHQLYIFSAFSIACLIILFRRMYIPPALVYALTFFSLCLVDVAEALRHAIHWHLPLSTFYWGVGGAGVFDALFIVPALTALAVAYAAIRLKAEHGTLLEF